MAGWSLWITVAFAAGTALAAVCLLRVLVGLVLSVAAPDVRQESVVDDETGAGQ